MEPKNSLFTSLMTSLIASGIVVFAGIKMTEKKISTMVADEIKKQVGQGEAGSGSSAGSLSDDEFNAKVAAGIDQYISDRRKLEQKARDEEEKKAREKVKNYRPVDFAKDHVRGPKNAPITMIEYSDTECPFCKRFHETAKKVEKEFRGKINWVYRHYPLAFHNPGAKKQAEASECAAELGGNDAFWKYLDAVYDRTKSGGKGFPMDKLVPLATELGLNTEKFKTCLDSGRYSKLVDDQLQEGMEIGIRGTPGNILIHHESGEIDFKPGAYPFEAFKETIEKMLSKK